MADLLGSATNLVSGIVSRIKDVKRKHEECKAFGTLAEKTLSVLKTLEAKALSDPTAITTIERVHQALNEADNAIESCYSATFLYASLYSEDYALRLKHAATELENSLAQTSLASVGMTADIQDELTTLSNQIQYARVEERAKMAEQTRALKDAFEIAFNQHGRESEEVNNIIRELIQQQTSSVDQLRNELVVLKKHAYEANSNKERQREFELNQIIAVLSESLGDVREALRVSQTLKECLCCPISKDIMRDPVILKDSGMAYDRSSITEWLRLGHRYDPLTNVELVSRELVLNSALRDACQIFLSQSGSPSIIVDNPQTENARHQIELGLYEGHGSFSIGATMIHACQLLVLEPNGALVGCTLYTGEDLGSQKNALEIGAGKWDCVTQEFSLGDSRFNYLGSIEIKTHIQKQTIEWSGKVSKVEAIDQDYSFILSYAPPPIGNELQVHPTILEMKGEIDAKSANIKYNSKMLVALERDRSVNGWIAFESTCQKCKSFGHISNGKWDENGSIQFLIYISSNDEPISSDSKPTNYTACFSVVGTLTQSERLSHPSFSAIITMAQGQGVMKKDKTITSPLDSLKFIEYSLIREASTPWHYLYPQPLKLFQPSRSTPDLNSTFSHYVHVGFELEGSQYVAKASLNVRYALIPHSQRAFGRSPLHVALEHNYVQIVKVESFQ